MLGIHLSKRTNEVIDILGQLGKGYSSLIVGKIADHAKVSKSASTKLMMYRFIDQFVFQTKFLL